MNHALQVIITIKLLSISKKLPHQRNTNNSMVTYSTLVNNPRQDYMKLQQHPRILTPSSSCSTMTITPADSQPTTLKDLNDATKSPTQSKHQVSSLWQSRSLSPIPSSRLKSRQIWKLKDFPQYPGQRTE
ncbi:hypothetical protein RRG08_012556 [Elysia crispata]|uniref:Uncharacterized protein n=1 Tax=Elysia crispata TaxID=231223 RepID=A0AAE1AP86_9GAST|nr:hypothetical protein RRG08_012556 [Elysia crispata]